MEQVGYPDHLLVITEYRIGDEDRRMRIEESMGQNEGFIDIRLGIINLGHSNDAGESMGTHFPPEQGRPLINPIRGAEYEDHGRALRECCPFLGERCGRDHRNVGTG
jgi:hypothetical protein